MANRFIVQSGGVASGNCDTLGTAGTLAYVFGSTSPVVAGDTIYWCAGAAGASYDITTASQQLVRSATGTSNAHVTVIGCNSSGVVNGAMPEVRATGTWATTISMFIIGTDAGANPLRYYDWLNVNWNANDLSYNVWNNSGTTGTGAGTNTTAYYHTFNNCRFQKSKHNGFSAFSGGVGTEVDNSFVFTNCEISGCGIVSSGAAAIGRGSNAATWVMDNCRITGNQTGISLLAASDKTFTASNCTFSDSTNGQGLSSQQMKINAYGCTFSGNNGSGLAFFASGDGSSIQHCRFLSNLTGISDAGWNGSYTSPYNRNLFNGNGNNFEDSVGGFITPPGQGNVYNQDYFPHFRGRAPR
ncbi:MAG: right-handed parallel beta-helix repeat-containing protein [Hyphomicrobiaceae bacterium]|nr:MAG: right-handed parallel beta-helix repeat-containing protein [Hyphomicrobiaceae bacterium]